MTCRTSSAACSAASSAPRKANPTNRPPISSPNGSKPSKPVSTAAPRNAKHRPRCTWRNEQKGAGSPCTLRLSHCSNILGGEGRALRPEGAEGPLPSERQPRPPRRLLRHTGHYAKHLVKQIRPDQRGIPRWVIRRRHLDQIAPDDIQPRATANYLQRLPRGQPAHLHRPRPRRKSGVKAVDVIGNINRRIPDLGPHLAHQPDQRLAPAFLGLHHRPTLAARPVEILRRIARPAQPNLEHLIVDQTPILPSPPERAAMRHRLAEH